MKNFLITLFFFLLITQICFGQWYQQNSGTTKNLNAVTFIESNTGWAVGDSGLILKTSDAGSSWIPIISGTTENLNDIQFVNANIGWIVGGTWQGSYPPYSFSAVILKTIDGGSNWFQQMADTTYRLNAVSFINDNTGWAVGGRNYGIPGTILKTTNGGNNWIALNCQMTYWLDVVHFMDANIGWAVGWGVLHKTEDGGFNWTYIQTGGCVVWSVYFIDSDTGWTVENTMAPRPEGIVCKTTDSGIVWSSQNLGVAAGHLSAIHFSDAYTGWVVGWPGAIYKTTDGGDNWVSQISGVSNTLRSVFVTDSNTAWAVGDNGTILHTTNGGVPVELTSFTAISNGEEVILNWTTATETNNAGFEILRSCLAGKQVTQNDNEWKLIGYVPGFGTTTEPKSYQYTDSKVSIGKYTYRLKQIDFDGSFEYLPDVEVEVSAPIAFSLEQSYPNPFNPSTTIGFGIQNKSNVKITILNAIGEEVAVLLNEEREAGFHQVEFNASSLPSGVYFYQLIAGNFVETKKMVLMK